RLGGGSTIAVLSRPLAPAHPIGWVVCHSFGLEQINLDQLDVIVARTLAAAGFTCLRFHAQGYGESELREVTLEGHVDGALDAVNLLLREPGVGRVGVMGARFGAVVAARAAER